MFDLNTIMREVWEDTRETDPATAAHEILDRLPEDSDEDTLLYLLDRAYSTYLSSARLWGVPEPEPEPEQPEPPSDRKKAPRRNPAVNPATHREEVMTSLDDRPFFVPSLRSRIRFKAMTVEYWEEWAELRRSRAAGYVNVAQWGDRNAREIENHGLTYSGELPDDVKRDLFSIKPDEPSEVPEDE